ncbi:hypothetical protein ACCQ08_24965 [Comamonas sp. SY3]|uniref:hypothetical protein n=1 Tax=Comamonas sp. SY3 TaxID=3243601 RepID=UPI0035939A6B
MSPDHPVFREASEQLANAIHSACEQFMEMTHCDIDIQVRSELDPVSENVSVSDRLRISIAAVEVKRD